MNYQTLLLERKENVAIVKINRPDKLNALNAITLDELKQIFISLRNVQSSFHQAWETSGKIRHNKPRAALKFNAIFIACVLCQYRDYQQ